MQVELTQEAEQDIIEHYLYGYEHFGKRQADLYEANIREIFSLIWQIVRLFPFWLSIYSGK